MRKSFVTMATHWGRVGNNGGKELCLPLQCRVNAVVFTPISGDVRSLFVPAERGLIAEGGWGGVGVGGVRGAWLQMMRHKCDFCMSIILKTKVQITWAVDQHLCFRTQFYTSSF